MSSSTTKPQSPFSHHLRHTCRSLISGSDRVSTTWLIIALTTVSIGSLAAGLAPLALKTMVDRLSSSSQHADLSQFPALVGFYVAALLVQRLCEQMQLFAYSTGEQRLVRRFGAAAFSHMLRLPLSVHLDHKSGALAQSLSNGLLGLRLILTHLSLTVTPVLVQIIVVSLILSKAVSPAIGFTLLALLIAYAVVFAAGIVRLGKSMSSVSAAQIDVGGLTTDSLMNIEAIKVHVAERRFATRYDDLLKDTERHWRTFLTRRLENGLTVSAVFAVAVGVICLLAGQQEISGTLSVGGFVLVVTYVLQLVRPVEMLGYAFRDIGQGLGYLDRLMAILGEASEHQDPSWPAGSPPPWITRQWRTADPLSRRDDEPSGAPSPPPQPAKLEFSHVSLSFGARQVLRDVSFSIQPGAVVGIVGPSGAGKSSLLRLALRLFTPDRGEIRFDDTPLPLISLAALRGQIALVSQDTILFNETIGENIALAVEIADETALLEATRQARLSDFISGLSEGLNTRVGERGLKLSGGEKQRVSIARAALKKARLVIFDEATASLDVSTEQAVWEEMSGLIKTATTLIVTHRLSTVAAADQILVLDQGQIVERGGHAHLMANAGLYASLWRTQNVGSYAAHDAPPIHTTEAIRP